MLRRSLSPFLMLLPCVPALADDTAAGTAGSALQLVLGFVAILGLLFATLWVLKRLSLPRGGGNMVRVVSAAAVGPRERVVLVDVGDKRLVLGVAPGSVSLLDTQQTPAMGTDVSAPSGDKPAFAQWLTQTLAKRREDR